MRISWIALWCWLCLPVGLASAKVCSNLLRKAGQLYARAVKLGPSKKPALKGKWEPICKSRIAGSKAATLYRAALVYRCPQAFRTYFRLGVLYQGCVVSKRASCRFYGQFRRACRKSGACKRSPIAKQGLFGKLLPFLILDARTDSDKDTFKSCLKTRIECSAVGAIKEIPIAGLAPGKVGKDGKKAPPCDCDDGDPKVYPGHHEICDGKDNDCDGSVDEIAELKPPLCANQRGVCRGSRRRCGGVRGWLHCEAPEFSRKGVAYEAKETKCDGLDNDCDGQTDNGLQAPKCRNQRGVCLGAVKVCGGKSGWQPCSVSDYQKRHKKFEVGETLCDGLDNDCDGRVDNIKEAPFCKLQLGVCVGLRQRCDGKRGWQACTEDRYRRNSAIYQKVETRCDNKDNDCDGYIDETCTPWYPWVIAGGGAALVLTGGLLRGLAFPSPNTVAAQPQQQRPEASATQATAAFADTSLILGGVIAAAGVGLGVWFLVRALRQHKPPPRPPKSKAKASSLRCQAPPSRGLVTLEVTP